MEEIQKELKNSLSLLAAGISVITYKINEKMGGLTVTSFTSLSIEPPIILVCIKKSAHSHGEIINSGSFAVNILSSSQENLSTGFAGQIDKQKLIEENGYKQKITGSPLLQGCIAILDCNIEKILDGGDHSIFLGRVIYTESSPELKPLLYFHRHYHTLG